MALVGSSGCGKSSALNLLQRFYLPDSGDVVIDGRDVGVYDPGWLKHNVGVVSETPTLFAKTIRENILLGMKSDSGTEVFLLFFKKGSLQIDITMSQNSVQIVWINFNLANQTQLLGGSILREYWK